MNELITFDQDKIDLIKRTVCKDATNDELEMFLYQCKRTGLDPLSKQIYSIKRGNTRTIQVAIDGFRLIADRTGNYAPGKETIYSYNAEGNVISATAFVMKRNNDGTWHEVSSTAFIEEFRPKYASSFWDNMPRVMIAKCAEAQALRRAFPADLSGLYTPEEMDQAERQKALEEKEKTIEVNPIDIEKENKVKAIEEEIEKNKVISVLKLATELQKKLNLTDGEFLGDYLMQFKDSLSKIDNPLEKFQSEAFVKGYQKWLEKKSSVA